MKNFSQHALAPVALAAACAVGAARADTADLTTLGLEQLMQLTVVGASKYEQKQSEVAAAVSIVTREEIRAFGWRTVDEVLGSLPGIHTTWDRQYVYLGARGFGLPGDFNTRVLVTVNGNRINDPTYDSGPMGRQVPLDLDLVERIEFIPGPGGAVYGQNAMFGVVNLVTRGGADIAGAEAAVGVQSLTREREGRLSVGRRFDGGLDLVVSASAFAARGQDLAMRFGDDAGVARGLDGRRDRDLFVGATYGAWSFDLLHGVHRKDDPTGAYFSDPLTPGQYQGDGYTVAQAQHTSRHADDRLHLTARLFAGAESYRSRLSYTDTESDPPLTTDYLFPADGRWLGGELRLLWTGIADHKLMLGVEAQRNHRSEQRIVDLSGATEEVRIDSRGSRGGIYLQDEWRIGESLAATFGLRVDDGSASDAEWSPRAALIWQAGAASTLKLLAGRAHRAPNAYERDYGDGFAQVANPALRGETIDTFELVGDHRVGADLALRASLYEWRMRDLITLGVDAATGVPQYQSGETVKASGLELSADKTWPGGARLRGSLSFQDVHLESGASLPNSPKRLLRLAWTTPLPVAGLRLGYELRAESARRTIESNRVADDRDRTGGFALSSLNLGASGWLPGLDLNLRVDNLFDRRYALPGADTNWQNALPQDGRAVRLEARLRF